MHSNLMTCTYKVLWFKSREIMQNKNKNKSCQAANASQFRVNPSSASV